MTDETHMKFNANDFPDVCYETNSSINVKQDYCIVIQNDLGKKLKLDFNTDKLIVTGDLEKSEAAERFFEHLNN